ncbi:hypothetical protein BDP81DRAFT_215110 [Colletotrichum phormii]|uniref:Uncharacterized protein n=1 Tax=Colletotrichum phormii TaxID=359342 RepID=A0AAJ0EIB0_9PEZI|nr:uncharacterized protein BDP81DRAFT_215110 [Colletotrichum phormii]KAK1637901.1 hypothetical protein BDP81DRAFT_215110 [Colletotrichum phormii]
MLQYTNRAAFSPSLNLSRLARCSRHWHTAQRPPARPPSNLRRPRELARHANASQGPNRPPWPTQRASTSINPHRLLHHILLHSQFPPPGGQSSTTRLFLSCHSPAAAFEVPTASPAVNYPPKPSRGGRQTVPRMPPECHPNSTPQNGQLVYPRAGWVAFYVPVHIIRYFRCIVYNFLVPIRQRTKTFTILCSSATQQVAVLVPTVRGINYYDWAIWS